jgi:hypothetical protein
MCEAKKAKVCPWLQDACVLSVGVSFAVIIVRVDLVSDSDLQVTITLILMFCFVRFIRGWMWFAMTGKN